MTTDHPMTDKDDGQRPADMLAAMEGWQEALMSNDSFVADAEDALGAGSAFGLGLLCAELNPDYARRFLARWCEHVSPTSQTFAEHWFRELERRVPIEPLE